MIQNGFHLRRLRARIFAAVLLVLFVVSCLFAAGFGAVPITTSQILAIVASKLGVHLGTSFSDLEATVLISIRFPRVALAALVGGGLAISGAVLQGLFRNPLADPGLLGVSSGATLSVSTCIVFHISSLGLYTLPLAAFLGSLLAIIVIYSLARQDRKTNVTTMLLAGIAINALCASGTGLMSYFSSEDQLRAITFWMLGSLGSATWSVVLSVAPFILLAVVVLPFLSGSLNAFLLGEANARHFGVPVEALKSILVVLIALAVGAGVAVSGVIGFVGLVVPHIVRLCTGPDHRAVLPCSALLGSSLLILADLGARSIVSPLELPLGIITSAIGAPCFLILLIRRKQTGEL